MKPIVMIGDVTSAMGVPFATHVAARPAMIAAVPSKGGAWGYDDEGRARYRVKWGDTFGDLAQKYLGNWGRYYDIWNVQPEAWRLKRLKPELPTALVEGDALYMPDKAADAARRMNLLGAAPAPAPPPPEPPVITLPEIVIEADPPAAAAPTPSRRWLWLGLAAVAAVGVGAVAFSGPTKPAPKAAPVRARRRRARR